MNIGNYSSSSKVLYAKRGDLERVVTATNECLAQEYRRVAKEKKPYSVVDGRSPPSAQNRSWTL